MKIKTLFVITLFLIPSFVFSADAVIKSFTGKVEIQEQGTSAWKSVVQGQKIRQGTVISTGFNSSAVLDLGNSEILIKPLTRISLNELVQQENVVKTDLNLSLGRVTADIKTTEGLKNDFTLRTPVSTAAVRGTKFTAGVKNISVEQGKIAYSNKIGQPRTVHGGSSSSVGTTGSSTTDTPDSAGESAMQNFAVITSVSKNKAGRIVPKGGASSGKVILNWDFAFS